MKTKMDNYMETYNELTIYVCCVNMTNLQNVAMSLELKNIQGWIIIGTAVLNVILNLLIMILTNCKDVRKKYKNCKFTHKAHAALKERKSNREKLITQFPDKFKNINELQQLEDDILFCQYWVTHRKWLRANDVTVTAFPEEKRF